MKRLKDHKQYCQVNNSTGEYTDKKKKMIDVLANEVVRG